MAGTDGDFSIAKLTTEIQTDPDTVGYAGKQNAEVVDLLNAIPSSGASAPYTVNDAEVQTAGFLGALTEAELDGTGDGAAWVAADHQILDRLLTQQRIANSPRVRGFVTRLHTESKISTATRDRLLALVQRDGSRAEERWGAGVRVTLAQVREA